MTDAPSTHGDDAYARLNEATIFADAFNQLLTPEDSGGFFLNVAHHFINYTSGVVIPIDNPSVSLARRGVGFSDERTLSDAMTAEKIDEMRRKLRIMVLPGPSGGKSVRVAVPFVFGGDLLACAVLLYDCPPLKEDDADILRVLGRAVGSALGRIYQAQKIEAERDYAEAIFHSIVSPIINVDTRGVIVNANEAARLALGENVIGRSYAPCFNFASYDPISDCLRTGLAQQHVDAPSRDGVMWGLTVSPLMVSRKLAGAIAGFRDITSNGHSDEDEPSS